MVPKTASGIVVPMFAQSMTASPAVRESIPVPTNARIITEIKLLLCVSTVATIPVQVAEKLLVVNFLRRVLKFPLENFVRDFSRKSNPNKKSPSPPKNCSIQLIIIDEV